MKNERKASGNAAVEFHDSKLGAIETESDKITIRFQPAYVHRSEGVPGIDAGTGWSQDAVMVLDGCTFSGNVAETPMAIWDGTFTVGDQAFNGYVPVPFDRVGDVQVSITLLDGSEIRISAKQVHFELLGDPTFVEDSW